MTYQWTVQEKLLGKWYVHYLTRNEMMARNEYRFVTGKYTGRTYRLCKRVVEPAWEVVIGEGAVA